MGWKRMSENMENLLREWAAIEPERCRLDTATNDLGVMLRDNWKKGLTFMGEPDPERIQGAVQEAIGARGWTWIIESSKSDPKYHAALDEMGNASLEWKNADTPAEALLSAYLQALKANA